MDLMTRSEQGSHMTKRTMFSLLVLILCVMLHGQACVELRIGVFSPVEGWKKVEYDGREIWIDPVPGISSGLISEAMYKLVTVEAKEKEAEEFQRQFPHAQILPQNPTPHLLLTFVFTKEGKRKLADLTKKHIDDCLLILMDEQIVAAPRIVGEIKVGAATVNSSITEADAKKIVQAI